MVVEVTLRGTMEADNNRYFLVLAGTNGLRIPLPPPNIIQDAPEFIEPGMVPQLGSPEAYYTNFYSTWTGYIMVDPSGCSLVEGPFSLGQTVTHEPISGPGESSTRITFNFDLERVFGAAVPQNIYFDFIAVPWPAGEAKVPADHLTSTNAYISKIAGSTITIPDEDDPGIDPALNIISCKVTIQ
jgi:hypothetical protein